MDSFEIEIDAERLTDCSCVGVTAGDKQLCTDRNNKHTASNHKKCLTSVCPGQAVLLPLPVASQSASQSFRLINSGRIGCPFWPVCAHCVQFCTGLTTAIFPLIFSDCTHCSKLLQTLPLFSSSISGHRQSECTKDEGNGHKGKSSGPLLLLTYCPFALLAPYFWPGLAFPFHQLLPLQLLAYT